MNVVFCWPFITGYMAACWRALSGRPEVTASVIGFQSNVSGSDWKFQDDVVRGLNCRLLSPDERNDETLIHNLVVQHRPDVVVFAGWAHGPYRSLLNLPQLARTKFIMTMDTPYRGTLRQRLGRFKVGGMLKRIDRVVVAGEGARQFALVLGVPEEKIRRGLYAADTTVFANLMEHRQAQAGGWPRRFLYMGRYQHEKGVDVLVDAYRSYRASVSDPWELTCCGTGPQAALLKLQPGITDKGFVQPAQQPAIFMSSGVLVLPSRLEPWGVVIVEACAAGLPVIHTEICGAALEMVRPYYNGIGVATGSVPMLADALRWCHQNYDQLPKMGANGRPLAGGYSADAWADRWVNMLRELCPR
jgi:glycosyltransferase involved in cell wall biosynthesis